MIVYMEKEPELAIFYLNIKINLAEKLSKIRIRNLQVIQFKINQNVYAPFLVLGISISYIYMLYIDGLHQLLN
jgi:hypothetical protein